MAPPTKYTDKITVYVSINESNANGITGKKTCECFNDGREPASVLTGTCECFNDGRYVYQENNYR